MAVRTTQLRGGQCIPMIGFGTGELIGREAEMAILAAIQAGIRLIDTAKIYDNETEVGTAILGSGLARKELFVTSKVWNDEQGYDSTIAACYESLNRLGMEYLDLYLIHWPATHRRNASWQAFVDLQKRGAVQHIGVSNYTVRHLRELMSRSDVVPAVNQVEFHPFIYEQQKELLKFCQRHQIVIEAYSPLQRINVDVHPAIRTVAAQMGKTPAQVVLRWCIQHGTVPLSRSRNSAHIEENLKVFDFELDDTAMRSLDNISDGERVTWDPATMR